MTATSSILAALRRQPVWIVLAVSSGACAAFNGVFAKLYVDFDTLALRGKGVHPPCCFPLKGRIKHDIPPKVSTMNSTDQQPASRTTTALTSTLSSHIALFLSLSPSNKIIEFVVRGTFFLLNLAFNAAMWALFTAALTRADSTTRVSIVNVSANFMITAVLGWMIFSERLNGLWWAGASLLAIGNVVIGRREEGKKLGGNSGLDETAGEAAESEGLLRAECDDGEDLVELDDATVGLGRAGNDDYRRLKRAEEADAPI